MRLVGTDENTFLSTSTSVSGRWFERPVDARWLPGKSRLPYLPDTQETRELYKHKALRSVWQKYQKKQSDIIRRKAKQLAEIERRKAEQEKRKKIKLY